MKSLTTREKLQLLTKFMEMNGDALRVNEHLMIQKDPDRQWHKVVVSLDGTGFSVLAQTIGFGGSNEDEALENSFMDMCETYGKQNITSWSQLELLVAVAGGN